jgi:hypothetical protein
MRYGIRRSPSVPERIPQIKSLGSGLMRIAHQPKKRLSEMERRMTTIWMVLRDTGPLPLEDQ